jgi:SAM-dependent methyltransferase
MQTVWDYTKLADAYLKRPAYSSQAIDRMCAFMGLRSGSRVCDIGAGAGHLTLELAGRGFHVKAIEPNDAMRKNGIQRTGEFVNIAWFEGSAENTGQDDNQFDAVTFGSSFNVCDQKMALEESVRISKSGGWFACMWNHRDLNDPIQGNIEKIIRCHLPDYDYGSRRQDQEPILKASGLFEQIELIEGEVCHQQNVEECVGAWRSHGTLHRQAGGNDVLFGKIIGEIELYLQSLKVGSVTIPYVTRLWAAKFLKK